MRIAVSGTHYSGKSTLVEEFLRAHPEFAHEPEPYTVLVEDYGEEFGAEPTAEEFLRQLEFNCERVRDYSPGDRVIFDRCPADFLAYIGALVDLDRESSRPSVLDVAVALAAPALRQLDLIVYLPLDDLDIDLPTDEDPKLRSAMDVRLAAILLDDSPGLFAACDPRVIELRGSASERLRSLENALPPKER
jgi:hypothetical protein